jgi:hypothetical protein
VAQREDKVLRISAANDKRMKELMETLKDESWGEKRPGKKPTLNQMMERLLDTAETVQGARVYYRVENTVYEDVSIARGQAIVLSAVRKELPEMPAMLIEIGVDEME